MQQILLIEQDLLHLVKIYWINSWTVNISWINEKKASFVAISVSFDADEAGESA